MWEAGELLGVGIGVGDRIGLGVGVDWVGGGGMLGVVLG